MKASFVIRGKVVTKKNFINFIKNGYQDCYLKSYLNKLFGFKTKINDWELHAKRDYEWYSYKVNNTIITITSQHFDIINQWIDEALAEKGIFNYNFTYSKRGDLQKLLN